jgi:hypothetical protein
MSSYVITVGIGGAAGREEIEQLAHVSMVDR